MGAKDDVEAQVRFVANLFGLQNDLVIVEGQLRADIALLAVAQDIVEPTRTHVKVCNRAKNHT